MQHHAATDGPEEVAGGHRPGPGPVTPSSQAVLSWEDRVPQEGKASAWGLRGRRWRWRGFSSVLSCGQGWSPKAPRRMASEWCPKTTRHLTNRSLSVLVSAHTSIPGPLKFVFTLPPRSRYNLSCPPPSVGTSKQLCSTPCGPGGRGPRRTAVTARGRAGEGAKGHQDPVLSGDPRQLQWGPRPSEEQGRKDASLETD